MKLLREYISAVASEPRAADGCLRIFDFDDTLVKTDAVVHVTAAGGETFDLLPGKFVEYDQQPGDTFDYRDFQQLVNPRPIVWTNRILRNVVARHGPQGAVVLSARSTSKPIEEFLQSQGLAGIEAVALGTPSHVAKAAWVSARIKQDELGMVEYFDDSVQNVTAVKALQGLHPNTKIIVHHVVARRIASLWD